MSASYSDLVKRWRYGAPGDLMLKPPALRFFLKRMHELAREQNLPVRHKES